MRAMNNSWTVDRRAAARRLALLGQKTRAELATPPRSIDGQY